MIAGLIIGWLAVGIVGFFTMRAAEGLTFGCNPVTVATLIGCFFMMWLGPVTIFVALVFFVLWAADASRRPAFLDIEIANPCAWFRRKAGK